MFGFEANRTWGDSGTTQCSGAIHASVSVCVHFILCVCPENKAQNNMLNIKDSRTESDIVVSACSILNLTQSESNMRVKWKHLCF